MAHQSSQIPVKPGIVQASPYSDTEKGPSMSPWLTLVIGIILGLLLGWLLDLFYRRRADKTAGVDAGETATKTPAWAAPLPAESAPAAEAAAVAAVAAVEPESEAHLVEVEPAAPAEEPAAPEAASAPEAVSAAEAPAEPDVPAVVAIDAKEETLGEIQARPEDVEAAAAAGEGESVSWPEVSDRVAEVAPEPEAAPEVESGIGPVAPLAPAAGQALPAAAVAAMAAGAAPEKTSDAGARDKLILIEGIGPVYEAKLNVAGIYTFRQLFETSPDTLREIIQPQSWQRVNFSEWTEQARLLMEGKDDELKALQARLFSRKRQ